MLTGGTPRNSVPAVHSVGVCGLPIVLLRNQDICDPKRNCLCMSWELRVTWEVGITLLVAKLEVRENGSLYKMHLISWLTAEAFRLGTVAPKRGSD